MRSIEAERCSPPLLMVQNLHPVSATAEFLEALKLPYDN